jgi:tRNA(fMet)-specific endonuclease VapC
LKIGLNASNRDPDDSGQRLFLPVKNNLAGIGPLNKAILDTDIFSEITKGVNQIVAAHAYGAVFTCSTISAVTFMEVIRGYQKKQASRQLRSFLAAIASEEVIQFDQTAAELAGIIDGELERTGRPIGLADTMIAAIALKQGLELVTGNTTHFQRIQQLGYPLVLANWRI